MMLSNKTSRYHIAATAIRAGVHYNPSVAIDAYEKSSYALHLAQKDKDYIYANGKGELPDSKCACRHILTKHSDPDGTFDTPKFE